MTVGELDFTLGIDGARRVESAINDVRDALIEAQAAVEALNGRTIDLDFDIDREAIKNALSEAVTEGGESAIAEALGEGDIDLGLDLDGEELTEAQAVADALDEREVDLDLDLDDAALVKAKVVTEALDERDIDLDLDLDEEALIEAKAVAEALDEKDVNLDLDLDDTALVEAQAVTEALDEKGIDLDLDLDEEALVEAQAVANALDGKEVDLNLDLDDTALVKTQAVVDALDGKEIDLNLDVDKSAIGTALSGTAAGGAGSAISEAADAASDAATSWEEVTGQNQSYARILSRLNDEAFAVSGLFAKMGGVTTAAIAGVTTATAALAGVSVAAGGLAAAATGLATKFGDLELRSDLARVKGAFQGLARSFVRQFEPLIRGEIIPAGLQLVDEIKAVIPDLVDLSRTWLPSLIDSVEGLVTSIDEVADGLSIIASLGDIIFESTEAVLETLPALAEGLLRNLKLLSEKITGFELPTGALTFYKNALLESGKSIESSTRTILGGGDLPESERDARSGGAVAARKGPSGTSAGSDLQEFVKVRREVEAIRRAMEETTEAGRPLISQAEGLKEQFRLVQDALISMTKQGIDNSQFEEFKGLLEEIRGRAKAAGVELGTAVEQAKELPEIETFSDRLSQFREATKGVMEGGQAPVAPLEEFIKFPTSVPSPLGKEARGEIENIKDQVEVGLLTPLEGAQQEVRVIGEEIRQAIQDGFEPGSTKIGNLRDELERAKKEMRSLSDSTEQFQAQLRQIAVKQVLRLGDAIAKNLVSGISDAITGLSKVEQIQKRLSKLQLRQQIQNLRGRLKEATGIDAQIINTRINLLTEQLEEARNEAGRLGQVFRDIGNAIVNTLKSVIQEVIALIAKMYIIKGLSAVLSGGSSFALGSIQGIGADGVLTNPGVGDILGSLNAARAASSVAALPTGGIETVTQSPSVEVEFSGANFSGGAIQIPAEVVSTANRVGERRKRRMGLKGRQ